MKNEMYSSIAEAIVGITLQPYGKVYDQVSAALGKAGIVTVADFNKAKGPVLYGIIAEVKSSLSIDPPAEVIEAMKRLGWEHVDHEHFHKEGEGIAYNCGIAIHGKLMMAFSGITLPKNVAIPGLCDELNRKYALCKFTISEDGDVAVAFNVGAVNQLEEFDRELLGACNVVQHILTEAGSALAQAERESAGGSLQ